MATSLSARPSTARPPLGGREHLARHLRRIAVVAALVALVPTAISYINAMSGPSNTALGVRSVEWLRDNGAASIVAQVENWYYSLTAPSKGGPPPKAVPKVGDAAGGPVAAARARAAVPYTPPARVAPFIKPVLAGEGVWHRARFGLGRTPPLLVTTIRNQPDYPQVFVALAWIDTKRTQTVLYPGRLEPSVTLPRGALDVPATRRSHLLATFNSGFKLIDSAGSLAPRAGYVLHAHTYSPMHNGLGTLIGYRDGRVNILNWTHGAVAPSSILYARQNLPLIVDHGRANPQLSTGAAWGATVGSAILVWRSGMGIDRHGNLIYAAGNDQTVMSLAAALIHAGAVRAMELDINSYWVSFITYAGWDALGPANLLTAMNRAATRYLTPDDRDFFAVYLRHKPLR